MKSVNMTMKMFKTIYSVSHSYSVNVILRKQVELSKNKYLGYRPRSHFMSNVTPFSTRVGLELQDDQSVMIEEDAKLKLKPKFPKVVSEATPKKKTVSQPKEIHDYFLSKNNLSIMTALPPKILKKKRTTPESFYIVDRDVAKNIVSVIKPHLIKGDAPILEVNPGLGLLTEELLEAGISNLRLFEPASFFLPHLNRLEDKYPGRIDIINSDLLLLYKQAFQDKLDNGCRVDNMLRDISTQKWSSDSSMKIIGALPTVNFIKHLIMSFIFQNGIMMLGRPQLYLAMPPPLYIHLTCDNKAGYLQYRSTTVLFQLIFKTQLLDKLPRKAFLPWEVAYSVSKKSKLKKVHCVDPEYLYLVKVEPRKDFFKTVVSVEKLQPLWYFIRQNLMSRKNRVIPQLEKWIPGCGPRLILGGVNIFTQFGDLTPQEVLSVFNEFVNWPEYPHCPFLPSMESNFLKMDGVTDGLEKDLEESGVDDEEHAEVEGLEH